ncbi:MAG: peptide chain release factor 1 [Oscillatoriales cyanobacterium C42_A2020_001]|nr:peptide chain release factor 1 [Leptolyngbyaceae cyanobacterium C42_A2020_001]
MLERLKRLPWLVLFQVAIVTAIISIALAWTIGLSAAALPALQPLFRLLLSPVLGMITEFAIAVGVGALAVFIFERLNRPLITTGSLWALVLCLAIVLLIAGFTGILPVGLIGVSYPQVVGMVVGVFWKGQPYWKSYRRW